MIWLVYGKVTIASAEPLAMGMMGFEGMVIRLRKSDSRARVQVLASAVLLPLVLHEVMGQRIAGVTEG